MNRARSSFCALKTQISHAQWCIASILDAVGAIALKSMISGSAAAVWHSVSLQQLHFANRFSLSAIGAVNIPDQVIAGRINRKEYLRSGRAFFDVQSDTVYVERFSQM